ncbi:MAG: FIST signal transduction protein [Acidimicrobiales bacterium]
MPFASALSEHPVPAHAAGEVIGSVLEAVGSAPDLAVIFATAPHTGAIEDIVAAVRSVLRPATLIGATAVSVLGGGREVEEVPALSLWAGRFPPGSAPVVPVRLRSQPSPHGMTLTGLPTATADGRHTLVLLPDPFTFPADEFLSVIADELPGLTVVGGLASAARAPGGNRLVLDGEIHTDGAVGALLPPRVAPVAVVSQGCRPIGDPMTVTKAERNVIYELAGRPALERLAELLEQLSPADRDLASSGVHLGRVIDEHKLDFTRGDFLIRTVLGGDREVGAIAVGDVVEIGSTVQFQVRDAGSADEDLRELVAGRRADGALVFTCNGRGTYLFGTPDHDASVINEAVAGGATAGMFCAGELGPVGGRSFLHGFTASVVLFSD